MPNYQDWVALPLDERLAKNAVAEANNMAARAFHHWRSREPSLVYEADKEGRYRDELAARECPDFALVRDVADAHKHLQLDRPSRILTRSDQTGPGHMRFGEGRYGQGVYGGGPQLVVTLDDGSRRPLNSVLKNVIAMWERLLTRWSL